jgi:hypothetical protein
VDADIFLVAPMELVQGIVSTFLEHWEGGRMGAFKLCISGKHLRVRKVMQLSNYIGHNEEILIE